MLNISLRYPWNRKLMVNIFRVCYPIALILLIAIPSSCEITSESTSREVPPTTSETASPHMFLPHVISSGLYERDMAISDDGTEMVYTLGSVTQDRRILVGLKKHDTTSWSNPVVLPFSGTYQDIEPFFAPKSSRLYFASNRPLSATDSTADYNIWYVEKRGNGWGVPIALPGFINTEKNEYYPSLTTEGHLYFTAKRPEGAGSEDIYRSEFREGAFQPPVPLDTTVNTKNDEFNAYISPEEDLLIFSSYGRPDDLGGGDLYYSTRTSDGDWKPAIHLQAPINSKRLDYCPFVDIKERKLYFTSTRFTEFGKRRETPESLRLRSENPGNGLGDIYCISLDSVIPLRQDDSE